MMFDSNFILKKQVIYKLDFGTYDNKRIRCSTYKSIQTIGIDNFFIFIEEN